MVREVPTLLINADSVPEAHYKAIEAVWNNGMQKRTQYDRKDSSGNYIDPPSRDARVMIHVANPFAEPRFSALSHCERGKYILELMGAKDHLVLNREDIKNGVAENDLSTMWPYTYSQRLTEWPSAEGRGVNQLDNVVGRLAQSLDSRRAVATTRCPDLDVLLVEDIPCLGEIHFRTLEDGEDIYLDTMTVWRSRDLFKAWADNVVGVTYRVRRIAETLGARINRPVTVGAYTDISNSLHIYGQDFTNFEADSEGRKGFFEVNPTVEDFLRKSMNSEDVREMMVLPEMRALKGEEYWDFPTERSAIIDREIQYLEGGHTP